MRDWSLFRHWLVLTDAERIRSIFYFANRMTISARKLRVNSGRVPRILREAYHDDALMTVEGRLLGQGRAAVDFQFPEYKRDRRNAPGHVSAVQISAAIIEGGLCCLEDAILSGLFPASATTEWFYGAWGGWIALRMNNLFRRAVVTGEVATLDFSVLDIGLQRLRRRKLSVTFEYDGFCSGESVWIIDPPEGLIV